MKRLLLNSIALGIVFLSAQFISAQSYFIDWFTIDGGYQLERTNALPLPFAPEWIPVTIAPATVNSRFRLTNSVAPAPARFYRLRQP